MSIIFLTVSTDLKPSGIYHTVNHHKAEAMTDITKIMLKVGSQEFQANLYNNPTSQSLLDQMPLTVEMDDYAGMEKIFYPKPGLSTDQAPSGMDPSVGDITYYAPWGDVAIFYKDFGYAKGLIPLGKLEDIEGFLNALAKTNTVTFEKG